MDRVGHLSWCDGIHRRHVGIGRVVVELTLVVKIMAHAVWKFVIDPNDHIEIDMPKGAKLLHVDTQFGSVCLWALVDPAAKHETRKFRFAGTGHPIFEDADSLRHVGTWLMNGGGLVLHLFEIL